MNNLRKQAEKIFTENLKENLEQLSPDEIQRLIHELRVHQIELELQNEELQRLHLEAEESRNRYADLYNFAPVGYLTVNDKGMIKQANLTCASMLGIERGRLLKLSISYLIATEDRDMYYLHRRKILETKTLQSCELHMQRKDNTQFYAHLDCAPDLDEKGDVTRIHIIVTDITEHKQTEEALEESKERFKSLYQESPIPTFTWQRNGGDFILVDFNRAAIQITGGKVGDHIGDSAEELYKNRPQVLSDINLCFRERSTLRREITSWHFAPGRHLFVHYGFIPPDLIIVHVEDQTDRKRAEEALNESEEKFRSISTSAQDAIVMMDNDGSITYWNEAAEKIFGYASGEVVGKELHALIMPQKYHQSVTKGLEHFQKTGKGNAVGKTLELSALRKDGTEFHVGLSLSAVQLQNKWSAIGIIRDITERKRLEEQLRTMSLTDELTGLYNRRGFFTLAQQQMKVTERTKKDMLLFFTDLDKMKQINDTLCHQEGDKALIEIAAILKEAFRESDIIGRVGGDEFAVLAIDTTDETREVLMKRLHNYLDDYNRLEGRNYHLALSIGIAHYNPETPSTIDELMAQADTLMYEEKRNRQR